MEYQDANYLDKTTIVSGTFKVCNHFDDKEAELKEQYKSGIKEWKQELIGNRAIAQMFNLKIAEAWNNLAEERMYLNGLYARSAILVGEQSEWNAWAIRRSTERKEQLEKILNSWQYKKDFYAGKIKDDKAPLDIEQAKSAPIEAVVGYPGEKRGKNIWFKCPLHSESAASMCWYPEQKRWWCYGESRGGDLIDMFQAINNCSFIDAVRHLVKY